MLMRLAEMHPSTVAALTYQYRMNEEICKLSSYLIYGGRLKCGNEEVRHRKLDLPGFPNALPVTVSQTKGLWPWLKMTVSPENPVIFVDTDNMRKIPPNGTSNKENVTMEALEEKRGGRAGGKVTNPIEAILARYIIKGLISSGANPKEIGVISPFRAQVQIFQDDPAMADWKKSGLEFSTIDRYQGRDKPVIILSLVRSNPDGNVGRLLQDKRRLNVALTRSKAKLIIVGSYSTLHKGSTALRPMLGRINSQGRRQLLPENALDCYQIP
jgi:DNA replication ATP-dependent helicase Dna2